MRITWPFVYGKSTLVIPSCFVNVSWSIRFLVTVVLVAFATWLRMQIAPRGGGAVFVTYYPIVIFAFFILGSWGGGIVTGISLFVAQYYFFAPYDEITIELKYFPQFGLFILTCGICGMLVSRLQRSRSLAESARRKAEETAAQKAQLVDELEHLNLHLREQEETLRKDISREIHDELGIVFAGLKFNLEALKCLDDPATRQHKVSETLDMVKEGINNARALCFRLRPSVLDHLPFANACESYVRNWEAMSGIPCDIDVRGSFEALNDAVRTDLFRIQQEFLTNVGRHATATRVHITLEAEGDIVRLQVVNDDKGEQAVWPVRDKARGFGLMGVRERLRRYQGRLDIDDTSPGFSITAYLPISGS